MVIKHNAALLDRVRHGLKSGARKVEDAARRIRADEQPWDEQFRAWIDEAQASGRDPNDVGDERWSDPRALLEEHYLPLFGSDSVVMELGPGTGRYTRHMLPRCREMVLVDYSKLVCGWLEGYCAGKGRYRIVLATDYAIAEVADESVDAVVANGVFEHLYLEGIHHYFQTFARVMKPGAKGCFNFDNIMSSGGLEHFLREVPSGMDERSVFRFYHPETIEMLCRHAGLEPLRMRTSESRFAYFTFAKPAR